MTPRKDQKMNTSNKNKLIILIEKLLSGKANVLEIKALFNFFQSHQKTYTWEEHSENKDVVGDRIYRNIQKEISDDGVERKVIKINFRKNLLKYAAVLLLGGLIGYSVLYRNISNTTQEVTASENSIKIGTNKAVLTLENGSIVLLEKGTDYTNSNLDSNGDEIVYAQDNTDKGNVNEEMQYNYLSVPRGGQFAITLSDNTKVWLNSESQLKYPVNFRSGMAREVELVYGEAYFDVSHSSLHNGDSFQVITDGQKIEVLGTEFNVKAYKDEAIIYTTLVEGEVSVSNSEVRQIMQPNQQYAFNTLNGTAQIYNINVNNEVSWKDGIFSFDNKSLKEIMVVLSRWYDMNVEFENKDIENIEFIGVLYKDRSIESILNTIKNVGSIKDYEIKNKNVILK